MKIFFLVFNSLILLCLSVFCLFFPEKMKSWVVGEREENSEQALKYFDSFMFKLVIKVVGIGASILLILHAYPLWQKL